MKFKDDDAAVDAIIGGENSRRRRKNSSTGLPGALPAGKMAGPAQSKEPDAGQPFQKGKNVEIPSPSASSRAKSRRADFKNLRDEEMKQEATASLEVHGSKTAAEVPYGQGASRFPQEVPTERPHTQNNKTLLIAVINTLIATIFALSINYYTEARIRDREVRKNSAILYSDIQNSSGNTAGIISEQEKNPETQSVLEVAHSGLLGSATENFLIYLNSLRETLGDKNYSAVLEYYNTLLTLEAVRKKYLYYQISGYTPKSKPMQTTYASYCELVREADRLYKSGSESFESVRRLFRNPD